MMRCLLAVLAVGLCTSTDGFLAFLKRGLHVKTQVASKKPCDCNCPQRAGSMAGALDGPPEIVWPEEPPPPPPPPPAPPPPDVPPPPPAPPPPPPVSPPLPDPPAINPIGFGDLPTLGPPPQPTLAPSLPPIPTPPPTTTTFPPTTSTTWAPTTSTPYPTTSTTAPPTTTVPPTTTAADGPFNPFAVQRLGVRPVFLQAGRCDCDCGYDSEAPYAAFGRVRAWR
mmetsp:Transcript_11008/g.24264  ORF Transcript_11008/g.24264 Transcript_11008/m.24264 type:complete len:224 (-) Transcript_11008:44-715(-)